MAGFNGFLMGETFMRSSNPGKACKDFIQQLEHAQKQFEHEKSLNYETESLRIK